VSWADAGWLALAVAVFAIFISNVVLVLTYAERKVLARMQQRLGPMRTGPWGLLQPIADAIKLMTKEDLTPGATDKRLFWLAPLVVFVPGFMLWVTVPFTRDLVIRNLEFGIFYIIAVSGLVTTGLVMAGWASSNKYAMLGALRSAAQLISYELPLIVAVLGVVMIAGSMDLREIVTQQGVVWFIVLQPLAFVIFFISGLAEVGRTPFDIPIAESEVVGGPFVEYSGMHWAMFFLAEYANTFAVAVLTTLLFLGGWRGWAPSGGTGQDVVQALWFLLKTSLVILLIFWIRATVPRLRIDQLMALAWKVLLPLAFLNLVLTGFYLYYDWPNWTIAITSLAVLGAVGYAYYRRRLDRVSRPVTVKLRVEHGRIVG
jgi:NADH-quinone oxidoreductase subunit H